MLSAVPQGSIPGPLLFSVFMNDLSSAVKYSNCLLFADDVKKNRQIKSSYGSWFLQSEINGCSNAVYFKLHETKRKQKQSNFIL